MVVSGWEEPAVWSRQTTLEVGDGNTGPPAASYCRSRTAVYLTLEGGTWLLLDGVPSQAGDMVLVLEVLYYHT